MKHKFSRMNQQRKDVCPSGYVWITNISTEPNYLFIDAIFNGGDFFQRTKDTYRKRFGDVQVVNDAYSNAGVRLNDDSVALYVPHPAIRKIWHWLKNHDKLKGGNLPY